MRVRTARSKFRILLFALGATALAGWSEGSWPAGVAEAGNFSTGPAPAHEFGVHEIVLSGDGGVANPLDTAATVTFTPPSGAKRAKTVNAFYDGENTWRARVYVSEVGAWNWSSTSKSDKGLDGKQGVFKAEDSKLRGRLLPHPKNPRQWMTEDGRWFLNVVDTGYPLLRPQSFSGAPTSDEDFHAYVRDGVDHGITAFFTNFPTGPGSVASEGDWAATFFGDPGFSQLRLDRFQFADRRLRWLLDHYPDIGIELILFPRGAGYATDEQVWKNLASEQKERILRYMVARYAAYPQLYFIVANDAHYGEKFPNNNAYAREVGAYFKQHDPWQHPMSTGHARNRDFFFGDEDWATFIHLESAYDLSASQCAKHQRFAKPVLLGEDRYEQDHIGRQIDPINMRYFQRRLYWAWLLSAGSANYGGRFWALHPYSQSGKRESRRPQSANKTASQLPALTGLDSVRYIRDYFGQRQLELSDFEPDDALARDLDGGQDVSAPKLMRRGQEEFLIYHPNAAANGREANVHAQRTARVRLDLRQAAGPFTVEWYRAHDGIAQPGEQITGGKETELAAPWPGHDIVLRLHKPGH